MKQLLAFLAGAILATAIAVVVVTRNQAPRQPVTVPVAEVAPAPQPQVVVVERAPAPVEEAPAVVQPAVNRRKKLRQFQPPVTRLITAVPSADLPLPPELLPVSSVATPVALQAAFAVAPELAPPEPHSVTLIGGTLITVRLAEEVSTESHQPGDTFEATLDQPLVVDGFIIAERGARAEGRVMSVTMPGRVKGNAELTIRLESIDTSDGQTVAVLSAPFVRQASSEKGRDAAKVGAAASIGALIGGIASGGKGAAVGAAIGGAASTGGILATKGGPARLESETRISFRLSEPVTIVERI